MLLLNQLRKQKDVYEDICIESIAKYESETWTIGEAQTKSLRNDVLQKNIKDSMGGQNYKLESSRKKFKKK